MEDVLFADIIYVIGKCCHCCGHQQKAEGFFVTSRLSIQIVVDNPAFYVWNHPIDIRQSLSSLLPQLPCLAYSIAAASSVKRTA